MHVDSDHHLIACHLKKWKGFIIIFFHMNEKRVLSFSARLRIEEAHFQPQDGTLGIDDKNSSPVNYYWRAGDLFYVFRLPWLLFFVVESLTYFITLSNATVALAVAAPLLAVIM